MKASTYISKIQKEQICSIATAEKLTEALHREGLLDENLVVRFRPLFGDFDILEKSWFTIQKSNVFIQVGKIENLMVVIQEIKKGA
jgi:hypothetical protein